MDDFTINERQYTSPTHFTTQVIKRGDLPGAFQELESIINQYKDRGYKIEELFNPKVLGKRPAIPPKIAQPAVVQPA